MQTVTIPDHVPADLIRPVEPIGANTPDADPFRALAQLIEGPEIFYDPNSFREAGGWIVTRSRLMREVLQDPELFSSKHIAGFSLLLGQNWDLIPLEKDPPEHTKYRQLVNPIFSLRMVNQLEPQLRERVNALIDRFQAKGECEFIEDFAAPFPVTVFMTLMGMPLEELDMCMAWENNLLHNHDMAARQKAAFQIYEYLQKLIADRRVNPKDDLVTLAVQAEVDGRPLTEEEIMGICYLFFVGGLDTVMATLGFSFRYLARHPEKVKELRDDPDLMSEAVEEMLRLHSVVTTRRFLTRDTNFHGIEMKKGDVVTCILALGSLDPEEAKCPMEADFHRDASRLFAFSAGPHRCVGSHLARREIKIALEEWLRRIPEFRIKEGAEISVHDGVFGLDNLPLVWDV